MAIDIDFAKIQAEINRQRGTGNRSTVSDLAPGIDMLLQTIQDIPRQKLEVENLQRRTNEYEKADLITQAKSLEDLSKLIRDDIGLANLKNTGQTISSRMKKYPSLIPHAEVIDQFISNKQDDYNTYSSEMEKAANIIDSPDFLKEKADFDNLEDNIQNIRNEDGSKKYEGLIDYLVTENDRINTILGRIDSSSRATQFRYNKNAKYMDSEIKDKLETYQKRLSVALQASIGDEIITTDEADYIMLGDVAAYKKDRNTQIKIQTDKIKQIDSAQKVIRSQHQRLKHKKIDKDTDPSLLADIFVANLKSEVPDVEEYSNKTLKGTTLEDMEKQLKDIMDNLITAKETAYKSFKAWSGRGYWDAPKTSKKETDELMENILEDDGKSINNVLDNKQQPSPKLTYDPAMGKTIVERNYNRAKKYKISMQQLGALEEAWLETGKDDTFDSFLDKMFRKAESAVDKLWKTMDKKEKSKYKSLAKFREAVKSKEK